MDDYRKAEQERERLRKQLKDSAGGQIIGEKGPSRPVSAKKLQVGDIVRIMPMGGVNGTVSSLPDKDNNFFVQIGFMKSKVNVKDVELAQGAGTAAYLESAKNAKTGSAGTVKKDKKFSPKSLTVSPEINLIGMTTDEARPVLEKYLDDAYLAHISPVRVVHGRGTGALKNMTHDYLKRLKYVDSYRLGVFGEGDTGVTVVTFK